MSKPITGPAKDFLYYSGQLFNYLMKAAKAIKAAATNVQFDQSLHLRKSPVVRKGNNRGQTDGRKAYSAGRFH